MFDKMHFVGQNVFSPMSFECGTGFLSKNGPAKHCNLQC